MTGRRQAARRAAAPEAGRSQTPEPATSPSRDEAAAPLPDRPAIEALVDASGYVLDDAAGYLIRRAHQRATLCFHDVLKGYDLTPRQFGALMTLLRHGELSQNLLGRLTSMDPANIKGVASRLMAAGLVERFASDADRRLGMLRLTPRGTRLALEILDAGDRISAAILEPIPQAERARFLELLRAIG